ncbi:MAG: enoyl-CoA hydratase/isomerase family protein [Rhizobiales bacterium]|nr:enoyl-CoA hydratase/isomerase family protein [Hyphomicrobiales bacterium]
MSAAPILCEISNGVATVTLNNPPLNLVTLELTRQLLETLDRLAADPNVRVMVLTGAGDRAFCAGSDISEFPSVMGKGVVVPKKLGPENDAYSRVDDFPKPTIAAVRGLAFGGGLELAVCCDLIVVEEGTRLCLPEIKLGVFPGSGGTVRVTRRVGEGRAKEMMFFGDPISAETALSWGLINRVTPKGDALRVAQEMAATLAERPNRAVQLCKAAVDLSFDMTEDEAVKQTLVLSDEAFSTEDCGEGVRAFFAKEPPRFKHR